LRYISQAIERNEESKLGVGALANSEEKMDKVFIYTIKA
jgi:hypothetical protein